MNRESEREWCNSYWQSKLGQNGGPKRVLRANPLDGPASRLEFTSTKGGGSMSVPWRGVRCCSLPGSAKDGPLNRRLPFSDCERGKGESPFDEMNQAPRSTFTGSDFEHLGLAQVTRGDCAHCSSPQLSSQFQGIIPTVRCSTARNRPSTMAEAPS